MNSSNSNPATESDAVPPLDMIELLPEHRRPGVGFPIHDRIGGQRVLHLGYRGAQEIYDRIVNALLEVKQETSPVGYAYL